MSSTIELVLDPILPGALVAVIGSVLAALTFWLYANLGKPVARWKNAALLWFRLSGLSLVLLLLLQPSAMETIPPPVTDRVALVAVGSSCSRKQQDAGKVARLDAAKQLLMDSGVGAREGTPTDARLRLLEFNEEAGPIAGSVFDVTARGRPTRFHQSVSSALGALSGQEAASALILLTDGHDFELANFSRTGLMARNRQTPIHAVAFGKQGKVRDVAARIPAYQPYCYAKQAARVAATLRLIGCEYEDLAVPLLRNGTVLETKRVNADEFQEVPVEFEVTEPEVGQFEHEVRAVPVVGALDPENNSAVTYLNVVDQQIGTSQGSRFMVFTENLKETEVATDVAYLRRLCESSGGRRLRPEELGPLGQELRSERVDLTPKTQLTSLWDRAMVFYVMGLLFGVDWYWRRRWGWS